MPTITGHHRLDWGLWQTHGAGVRNGFIRAIAGARSACAHLHGALRQVLAFCRADA